jgi:chromosome partitioning protein
MPTIAVLNPKGGSGKTTVATCLARALESDGSRVLLVDSDPQGSARDWHAIDPDNPTPVVGMDRAGGLRTLEQMAGYDWMVIDGAGRYEKITAEAVRIADLVLIPVQPSPYDIWAISELVDLVKQRQTITGGQPILGAVISRTVPGTVLGRDINEALFGIGVEQLDAQLGQRQIYPQTANQGRTPLEADPDGKAAFEVAALADEIREVFKDGS